MCSSDLVIVAELNNISICRFLLLGLASNFYFPEKDPSAPYLGVGMVGKEL